MKTSTDFRQLPLEAFASTDLAQPIGLFEDLGKHVLPLFLSAIELLSLARSNSAWGKLLKTHFTHLGEDWKKHSFLKHQIEAQKDLPLTVIESLFFDTFETSKPLAKEFGVTQELEEVTLEQFPQYIEDLNLVAFCEDLNFNDKPIKAPDETLSCYAKQLRAWIKNTPFLAAVTVLNLSEKGFTVLPEEIGFFTRLEYLEVV